MWEKAINDYPIMLKVLPHRCKTCGIDIFYTFEWVRDWFVTIKMLKDLHNNGFDKTDFDKLTTWNNKYIQRKACKKR